MTTISDQYLQTQIALHENPNYGVASLHYAPLAKLICEKTGARSISDYGAGKCKLRQGLEAVRFRDFSYSPFDPAFPEYGKPVPADLVCCIDVLEHIEPDLLHNVLQDLAAITTRYGLFTIATRPAPKTLSDGRNAHLIQSPPRGGSRSSCAISKSSICSTSDVTDARTRRGCAGRSASRLNCRASTIWPTTRRTASGLS